MVALHWLGRSARSVLLTLVAALGLLASVFAYGRSQKKQGAKEAAAKGRDDDYEHADALRTRLLRDRPDRLHDYDKAGFRD